MRHFPALHGWFIVLAVAALFPFPASAFNLVTRNSMVELGPHYSYLEDPGLKLRIDEIISGDFSGQFKSLGVREPNLGYSHSAFWMRVEVDNRLHETSEWLMEMPFPTLDKIDVYLVDKTGGAILSHQSAGDLRPFDERPYPHRNFVFPLTLPPDKKMEIVTRVESKGSLTVSALLWPPALFHHHSELASIAMSLYFGILLALFAYNLLLYIPLRDNSYLYYVCFVSAMALGQVSWNGIGNQYLWPDFPAWGNVSSIVGFDATGMLGAIFSRVFLNTRKSAPSLDKAILVCAIVFALLLVTIPIVPYQVNAIITSITGVAFSLIATVSGVVCFKRGFSAARYFLLAWSMLLMGTAALGARNLGWIPTNFMTRYSMQIGSALEMLLLSFALADRINIMRKEKEEAQRAYHATLEKAKAELEEKVASRTAELAAAKERAEQATKLKDKFISLVSHDLRSPLSSIKGIVDLMKGQTYFELSAENMKEALGKMSTVVDSLLALTGKLLDISRLQSGRIRLQKGFVNARILVDKHLEQISIQSDRKNISMYNHLPPDLRLLCDPDLFGQVISNLLYNSLKFCASGDTVTIFQPEGMPTTIAVKDTGPGIKEAFIPDIFKQEVKTVGIGSSGEKGTGLGLPHCFDIMKAHGGTMTVESAKGHGATFYITLPEAETIILIVDDQDAHREMMKECLAKYAPKAVFIEVENGLQALNAIDKVRPDLIITDINMPEIDGLKLITFIRKKPDAAKIPIVVATSGFSDGKISTDELKEKVFTLGANGFTIKPITDESFIPEVCRFIKTCKGTEIFKKL